MNTRAPADPPSGLLQSVVESVGIGIGVYDGDGRYVYVNSAYTALFSVSPSELVGVPVWEVAAEIAPDRFDAYWASFDEGETREVRTVHAYNSYRVPVVTGTTRRTIDGTGYHVVTVEDVSERGAVDRDHRDVLDRMTDGFFTLDTDWTVTYANETGRDILAHTMGRDAETTTVEGLHLWDEIPEAVGTTFYEKYHEAVDTQEPVTLEEYYEPLDSWFSVRAFPSEDGLSIYVRDVTDRRRKEDALERREQVLREMHAIIADRERSFTEQVEALLALGRAELGTAFGTLSHIDGDDYVFEAVDAETGDITAGDIVPVEATNCELVATDRETLVAGNVARDIPDETDRVGYTEWGISCYLGAPVMVDGEVYGTFCFYGTEPREGQFSEWEVTFVDLLAQWASYELSRQSTTQRLAAQNERLEQFASVVSHDLRNPLNVLEGRLELARRTGDAEHLAACEQAVTRMSQLIDDLLTLARMGTELDGREPVALDRVATACWAQVASGEATLTVDSDRQFVADRSRLRQLLENLLRNAVEHGGDGVEVRIGDLPDGFFIEDDGPGIPADERDAVFGWGHSTREDGTGFGLSIARAVAEAHGWEIAVTGSAEGGARFELTGVGRPDTSSGPE